MSIVAILSIFSSCCLLETIERVNLLKSTTYELEMSNLENEDDKFLYSDNYEQIALRNKNSASYVISTENKVEITDLCKIYMGNNGRNIYSCFLSIYIYGTLTAYCSVFAESLSVHTPLFTSQNVNYNIYLSIFFVLVVPFSCFELNEQIEWQVFLAICRIVLVVLMLVSIYISVIDTDTNPNADGALSGFMFVDYPDAPYGSNLVNFKGSIVLLPIAAFSNIFHHSIPSLIQPVKDKKYLFEIFLSSIIFCFFSFTSIGCILAYFFGQSIPNSVSY